MSLKVDFLVKSELMYEARLRGIDVEEDILVVELRKKLRELVKLGVKPNASNLANKVKGGEEYEVIQGNLNLLKDKIIALSENKSVSEVIRTEVKLGHYETRLKIFKILFESSETGVVKVGILQEQLNSLKEMLKNISVDLEEKSHIELEITQNGEIEDEFEQSLISPRPAGRSIITSKPVPAGLEDNLVVTASSHVGQNNLNYNKLPNPLERFLNKFKVTDGLNANNLLSFLRNMLALKNETKLKDSQILEITMGYCNAPLYDKIRKCKEERATISETHVALLKQFIPMGLRENLKRDLVTRPMDKLYIDIFGPLTRSKKQNKYLLIVVDDFTKFNWLFPMKEIRAKKIIELLNDRIFSIFSLPKLIVSDNAGYFMSQELRQFFFKKCIDHKTTIPYQPQGNKSERYLRNLKAILKIYAHDKQNKWDEELSELNLAINNNTCESTGYSGFQLMFSHTKNDPLTNKWSLNELVENKVSQEEKLRRFQSAVDQLRKKIQQNRQRTTGGDTTADPRLQPGRQVYVRARSQSNLGKGFQAKLHVLYDGPFIVLTKLSDVGLLVQDVNNPRDVRRVHIKDVKTQG